MALTSLIEAKGADLEGSRILLFSYGSGLAAGMFVLKGRAVPGAFALHHVQSKVRLSSCYCGGQALPVQCALIAHDMTLHSCVCEFSKVDLSRLWQLGFNPYVDSLTCMYFFLNIDFDQQVNLQNRLQQRTKASPEEFAETMHVLEQRFQAAKYHPVSSAATLYPHTYYLKSIDHAYRSSYSRVD